MNVKDPHMNCMLKIQTLHIYFFFLLSFELPWLLYSISRN